MESGWTKICSGDYYKGFDELCSVSPLAKEALISTAVRYLGQDMAKLLQYNKRLQRLDSVQDVQSFSWEEVLHEANDLCPDLVTLIDHLLQQGKRLHGKPTATKVKRPNVAIGMVLSLLLHFQDSTSYKATQQLTSLLLHLSGCKEQLTYLSLSHLGVCLGPASTLDFVSKFKDQTDVCDVFKNTDLGTLGNNSIKLQQGSLAQRRKERLEQEENERKLKEEEMDVEQQWKDQLRQAAEEMGLGDSDVVSTETDPEETDSTEASSDDISSSDVDGDADDHNEDFEFYEQWKQELNQAAEAMGVDKEDLISGNSNNASTNEDDIKEDDIKDGDDDDADDVQILDESDGELEVLQDDEEDEKMAPHQADADQSTKLTKNGADLHQTAQNTNGHGTGLHQPGQNGQSANASNGKLSSEKKDWNIATNFYSKHSKPAQLREVKCSEERHVSFVRTSVFREVMTSPGKNARGLCAKINQIDLTPAEEERNEDDASPSDDEGGGNVVPTMEVEDVGGGDAGGAEGNVDSTSLFSHSYLHNKRFSREPVSPPKRTKTSGDSMEDVEPR